MPSSEPSNNDTQPSAASGALTSTSPDLSSPSSTATTLVSHSNSRASSHPSHRAPNALKTHDENSVTDTEPPSLASSMTVREAPIDAAQRRILQLKHEMHKAGAELPQYGTKGLFREAYSTDLLFLMDTTGSMKPYIDAAKDQVKTIIKGIKAAFFNDAEIRMAVVSYKDHHNAINIQWLDFTTSVDKVHSFLDKLNAIANYDTPEDVLGGMNQALNASWKHQTRCIIHIGDAPPHGTKYHDLTAMKVKDDWPEAGSEPHKLTLEPLLDRMIKLNINYALLRITNLTDRMASIIYGKYAAASASCKLHPANKFAAKMPEKLGDPSKGVYSGLLFEEQELGTQFTALQHLVIRSVTQSASRSAVRMVSSVTKSSKLDTGTRLDTALADINEEDGQDPQMEKRKPQWNKRGWLDETLTVEGFSPNLSIESSSTLDDMLEHEDNIKINAVELLIHKRSRPFSQGATRLAFYARAQTMTDRFVVKSYKREGKLFAHFAKDMQGQALCKAYALEFNSLLGKETILDFIVTTCLKGRRGSILDYEEGEEEFLSLEPFIEGSYIKYNNNCGHVNRELPEDPSNKAAQAFSHFTFERSQGQFLVCDLQGVGGLLTDPAIHTRDPERFKLGDTNLGMDGFKFFFATHVCNDICERLKLKSNANMITRDVYDFRPDWPALGNTFRCCSNKLCGRITRLPDDYNPDQPQRYHWCHSCYLQMRASFERLVCAVPKPKHDFTVSRFLCESQGLPMPRTCPQHRGHEVELLDKRRDSRKSSVGSSEKTKSPVVTEGGSLWSKMKNVGKKSSK